MNASIERAHSDAQRAGRFGTKGLAITFASDDNDAKILESVQSRTLQAQMGLDEFGPL